MRTINDIRKNPAILKELRWDLTPEKLAIPKDAQFNPENAGYYFCIYLRGSKSCLALLHYLPDGTATQDCIEGIPEDIILEALRDADGSEYHPINKPIEKLLRMGLYGASRNAKPELSKLRVRQLLDRLMELLHQTHGGDYYTRFNEIAKERGRKVESSHFSRMDTVSIQLLIETIEGLTTDNIARRKAVALVKSTIAVMQQQPQSLEDLSVRKMQIEKLQSAITYLEGAP